MELLSIDLLIWASGAEVFGEQQKVKNRLKSPTRRKVPHPWALYIIFSNAVLVGVPIR